MKKKREFLPSNKTNAINSLFFRTIGRDDVDQWIKRRPYFPLIRQMHLMLSFSRITVEATWTNEKKERLFPRLIGQNRRSLLVTH